MPRGRSLRNCNDDCGGGGAGAGGRRSLERPVVFRAAPADSGCRCPIDDCRFGERNAREDEPDVQLAQYYHHHHHHHHYRRYRHHHWYHHHHHHWYHHHHHHQFTNGG